MKDDRERNEIKVIGVSAGVADKVRVEAFAADCDDFVSKPVGTKVLMEKLKAQLQVEWIEREAEEKGGAIDGGRRRSGQAAAPGCLGRDRSSCREGGVHQG